MIEAVLLTLTGVVGGIITTLVGGASLVTYPALVAIGLPPVSAAIVNLVALTPANLYGAWIDRRVLPPASRPVVAMLAISMVCAVIGAVLLLMTPERFFMALVPLLLGLSTWLFASAASLSKWIESRSASAAAADRNRWTIVNLAMVPVGIYGGYFGAGNGVVMLALLMLVAHGDYRGANALKNLVAGALSVVAAVVYMVQGAVDWTPVFYVMAGGLVGGSIGMRVVQRAPREVMRRAVIWAGAALTLIFAWRYWL